MREKKQNKQAGMLVEVRSGVMQTRDKMVKQGDIIEIPADEKKQTSQQKWGLRSGNLKVVKTTMDLAPVSSEEVPPEE